MKGSIKQPFQGELGTSFRTSPFYVLRRTAMAQMSEHHCPTCGISITADQRFCTNCGTVLEAQPPPPSQYGAQPPSQSYPYSQQTPPYAQQPQQMQPYAQQQVPSYAQSPQQQVPPYAQQQQPQNQSPIAEAF